MGWGLDVRSIGREDDSVGSIRVSIDRLFGESCKYSSAHRLPFVLCATEHMDW